MNKSRITSWSLRRIIVLLPLAALNIRAADIVWTNTAGGNWGTAANWSPNQVPGASDNAWITNNGSYTVIINANASVGSLTAGAESGTQTLSLSSGTFTVNNASLLDTNCSFAISGGTLSGSGTVAVNGLFTWTSGTLQGGGVLNANGGMVLSGAGDKFLSGRVVNNAGAATWSGGLIRLTAAA
jgi:hypothetical protein